MMGRGPAPGADRTRLAPVVATLLIAAILPLVAGCGDARDASSSSSPTTTPAPSGDALTVVVEPLEASPGDEVAARVVNDGEKTYTYGAAYELERRVGQSWVGVKLPPRPIPEIGYVAGPGDSGPPVTVEVPDDAEPGDWRVVIDRSAPGVGLLAGSFEVVDG
jgi:hypothetical protein